MFATDVESMWELVWIGEGMVPVLSLWHDVGGRLIWWLVMLKLEVSESKSSHNHTAKEFRANAEP